jgi:hypothetical protein
MLNLPLHTVMTPTKIIERRKRRKIKLTVRKQALTELSITVNMQWEENPKEVPASAGLDENDNYIVRREQNQPKQKKSRRTRKKENKSL